MASAAPWLRHGRRKGRRGFQKIFGNGEWCDALAGRGCVCVRKIGGVSGDKRGFVHACECLLRGSSLLGSACVYTVQVEEAHRIPLSSHD